MARVSTWAKFTSRVIQIYFGFSPISRGKHWLLRRSAGFLVVPIGSGLWLRVSGASGFEWKALRRQPVERVTVDLFRQLLKPDAVVFDIGANVGYYALLASK